MNSIKLELEKKKAQLAELKRRKRERELEKSAKIENSTQTTTFSYTKSNGGLEINKNSNGFDITRTFHNTKCKLNEFENLNANEILNKCGLNEISDHKTSINTASPSSSVSISMSSSCQSFKSSVNNAQVLNSSIDNSIYPKILNKSDPTEYEVFNKKM